jgi:hypothetical protein
MLIPFLNERINCFAPSIPLGANGILGLESFNNKLTKGLFGFLKIVNTGILFIIAVIGAISQFAM